MHCKSERYARKGPQHGADVAETAVTISRQHQQRSAVRPAVVSKLQIAETSSGKALLGEIGHVLAPRFLHPLGDGERTVRNAGASDSTVIGGVTR